MITRGLVGAFFLLMLCTLPVRAIDIPEFPSCPNPGGSLKVSYASGVHGIPGRTERFEGQDSVYILSEDRTVQCYCAPNSSGIQTNWWRVSSLTSEDKAMLIAKGWVYIPDGSAWGLDPSDWMAKNIDMNCGEKGGSGGSSGSSTSSVSSSVVTAVTAILPAILGFADTGRQLLFRKLFLSLGALFCTLGIAIFLLTQEQHNSSPKRVKIRKK